MLIFRYLSKEVFITLISLTIILLLIFLSNQFVQYLTRAANGQIPAMFIFKLLLLELPNLLGLLLPLGFYVSVLLAYGRLYVDSEMTVLHACGYGTKNLLRDTMIMATWVATIVGVIVLWGSPYIAIERTKLLRSTGVQMLVKTILPERFQILPGGNDVFYVEAMNREHTRAKNIFLARNLPENQTWQILWANEAYMVTSNHQVDYLRFNQGHSYVGKPGQADYQISSFDTFEARLPQPEFNFKPDDLRVVKTSLLWPLNNPSLLKEAELQWRLSIPIMVFVLTLIAVPLSRVNPRAGKYSNLLPAIVIFFFYANFLFISRGWIIDQKIPTWVGVWWLHLVMSGLGIFLLWRNRQRLA